METFHACFHFLAWARDSLESDVDEVVHSESETKTDNIHNSNLELSNIEENKDGDIDTAEGSDKPVADPAAQLDHFQLLDQYCCWKLFRTGS